MTLSLWLRLWPTTTIVILLVTQLQVPFDPIRRWLNRAPHLECDDLGRVWRIVNHDGTAAHPQQFPTRAQAASHVRNPDRVKAWLADMTSCAWCCGFWTAGAVLGGYAVCWGEIQVLWWWPALWTASAGMVVTFWGER